MSDTHTFTKPFSISNANDTAPLHQYEKLMVADALEPVTFAESETVVRQGATGDVFYIILEVWDTVSTLHSLTERREEALSCNWTLERGKRRGYQSWALQITLGRSLC